MAAAAPTKDTVLKVFYDLEKDSQRAQDLATGFLVGLSFSDRDAVLASGVHRRLRFEWASDPANPEGYGPDAFMIRLLNALGGGG